jgi:uncharacterized protein (TIGR02117 family)
MIWKCIKWIGLILLGFIVFVALYLLCAYTFSRIPVNSKQTASDEVQIYLLTNGVHTDIVMPLRSADRDWTQQIPFSNTSGNDTLAQYLALGWGDKGFYLNTPTWADLKFSTAFNAAFGRSTAAIHATFYRSLQESEHCVRIGISREQYRRMLAFIDASFTRDAAQLPIHIVTNANYGSNDAFYEAGGQYSMLHTCNTWSNNVLKAGGLKACLWTAFDTGIFRLYGRSGKVE